MSLATIHPPVLDLDPKRIAATSAAIAVHAFAFLLLLAPVQFSPPAEPIEPVENFIPFEEKILPPPPPPPPVNVTTNPPQTNTPVQEVMPQLPPAPIDAVLPEFPPADVIADSEFPPGNFGETIAPSGPRELTVLFGPAPNYPIAELRAGAQGRVVLRIEVDATGKPIDGSIESSSGSRGLDRAALKFVIAKWRFEPARHNGQPIAATALVPIEFVIPQ